MNVGDRQQKHGGRDDSGFTLIEVMFSLSLFALLALSMATSFIYHSKTNLENEIRSGAISAAQMVLDELRTVDPSTLAPSGSSTKAVTVGTRSYSVVTANCPGGVSDPFCKKDASGNITTMVHLKVTVNYKTKKRYETETVYTQLK